MWDDSIRPAHVRVFQVPPPTHHPSAAGDELVKKQPEQDNAYAEIVKGLEKVIRKMTRHNLVEPQRRELAEAIAAWLLGKRP